MGPIRDEIAALELSGIGKIAAGAMHDPEVIPLWFGESDLVTPRSSARPPSGRWTRAAPSTTTRAASCRLREALQRYHARLYGLELHPDRITVPGSTMLTVVCAMQCLAARGDEVILIGPYWPNVRNVCTMMGAAHVDVRLAESGGRWHLDLDAVAAAVTPRTKAVYVNSPSNPTGWVMTRPGQEALLDLCRRHGLGLIADEVYHRNVLPAPTRRRPS